MDPKNSPFSIKYDNNIGMIGYGFKKNRQLARLYSLNKLHCPYSIWKWHASCIVANVKNHHFILNWKELTFKVWRGLKDKDFSYEEWEVAWKTFIMQQNQELDLHTKIYGMVQDAFQQVDQLNILEEISIEVV